MKSRIDVNSISKLKEHGIKKAVVAIGVFDGVHIGHRHLLERLKSMAEKSSAVPVVLTFFPHPRQVLKPNENLLLLVSHPKKIELLHSAGIKAVVTFPFTKEFASLPASEFLETCLFDKNVEILGICVGQKWKFGNGGTGDVNLLANFARNQGMLFDPVEEYAINGETVSSSAIRRAISAGFLDKASLFLTRNHSLQGTVEHGYNIGAKVLNCPTANISVMSGILPPNGVYAGYAILNTRKYNAALSIGTAPTFGHIKKTLIEAHIFDFSREIYGQELEIEFVKHVREEKVFTSVDILKKQIELDLNEIRGILEKPLSK